MVRIIKDNEANALLEQGTPMIPGELGRLFVTQTWLPDNPHATIKLDLQGFLGTKTIKATGLKKISLY